MLIVLGGLPGVGKTSIARAFSRVVSAVHVRIDSIEEATRALAAFIIRLLAHFQSLGTVSAIDYNEYSKVLDD
jgi:MoxR-like ATPase